MEKIKMFKPGDIYLIDSNKIGAKIVKFLQIAPTVWQYIWRAIRRTNQEVRMYHAGIVVDDILTIEQQRVVEYGNVQDDILDRPHIVYRNIKMTDTQRENLVKLAEQDLGEGYDVLLCFGKLLTWLTGIKWFTRILQKDEKEICVTRVAYWYYKQMGIKFGKRMWHEVTTDDIDNFCANSKSWEVVSQQFGEEL